MLWFIAGGSDVAVIDFVVCSVVVLVVCVADDVVVTCVVAIVFLVFLLDFVVFCFMTIWNYVEITES